MTVGCTASAFASSSVASPLSTSMKSIPAFSASFLHFSRPDVGPLRDYETWMPDFMAGLARTIRASEHLVTGAVQDVANNMSMAMRPAGATVRLENVAFYGYTPEQGTRFVNDLNRKLGRLL